MSDVVAAAVKVRDVTGQLPTDILKAVLHRKSEAEATLERRRAGKIDEASVERWHEDGTFDELEAGDSIKAGVLQIIASELVGQPKQACAGRSECMTELMGCLTRDKKRMSIGIQDKRHPKPKQLAKTASAVESRVGRCRLNHLIISRSVL